VRGAESEWTQLALFVGDDVLRGVRLRASGARWREGAVREAASAGAVSGEYVWMSSAVRCVR
jgi:hypothetical protein